MLLMKGGSSSKTFRQLRERPLRNYFCSRPLAPDGNGS
jgi:hypothetical protein